MNSEKVKEIKEKLKKQYYYLDQAYSDHLAYGGKGNDKQEEEIYFLRDVLTLINEFESENEKIKQSAKNLAFVNEKVIKQNNELKDRIIELEKENADYKDTNNILRTRIDKSKELSNRNGELLLKQFAKRLKEKMGVREYMGVKYNQGVFREKDIDETLKEFMGREI